MLLYYFLFSSADYSVASNIISLNPVTNPRGCFMITVIDDAIAEGNEVITLSVQLTTAIAGQLQPSNLTAEIIIIDDEITRTLFLL